jgi:hypothetical protein
MTNIVRVKEAELDGACNTHGGMRNAHQILLGIPDDPKLLQPHGEDGVIIL